MPERIQCPSCGAGLIVSKSSGDWRATCPRCLAEIAVPEATAVPNAIQAESPARREAPLRSRQSDIYGQADLDVRRDMKQTGCLVGGLAVLGLGMVYVSFVAGSPDAYQATIPPIIRLVYLVVAAVPLVGSLIVYLRSGGNPGANGFRRVVVGTLALAAAATLVILLVIVSFIILVLITCGPNFSVLGG